MHRRLTLYGFVIWAGAILLFRLATARWQNWDRLEQDVAKGPVANLPVNRWPAYLAAGGFVLVVAAAALAVLFRPEELPLIATGVAPIDKIATAPGLAVIGLVLFAISYAVGTGASVNRPDPIMAPDPPVYAVAIRQARSTASDPELTRMHVSRPRELGIVASRRSPSSTPC